MDDDGYPEEDELAVIRKWPHKDYTELLKYVQSLWRYENYIEEHSTGQWKASTGGWSGNEDIIGELMGNQVFWLMCWVSSRRGGHYEFEIPERLR